MHKDKPPGIFDLADRSLGYVVGFGLVTGFLLSIIGWIGYLLMTEHYANVGAPWGQ